MSKVNLDALIPREDFAATEPINPSTKPLKDRVSIVDFEKNAWFLPFLRKPDFQRETSEWDSEKILQLVESFIDGNLIPALILWRSPSGFVFVIDGSHRLSSILAWIYDDYGDGTISKKFYDWSISDERTRIGEMTRKMVVKHVGKYEDLRQATMSSSDKIPSVMLNRAKNLGVLAIQVQWVDGDIKTAEDSYLKINRQAAPIDPTELKLIESRKKPNCIAARAIKHAGKGHKYWSSFSMGMQGEIQKVAYDVYDILFSPKLETPIKTLDIPIGGKPDSAQALPLVLDFVNMTNVIPSDFKDYYEKKPDDTDGSQTLDVLKKTKKVAQRINSTHPGSLGLHPIVYFYSQDGRYKIASFYATVSFVMELDEKGLLSKFTEVRRRFEKTLIESDYLVQQINRRFRVALKSYPHIRSFFMDIVGLLDKGVTSEDIANTIIQMERYKYLTLQKDFSVVTSPKFSSTAKSAAYIRDALSSAPTCKICGGLVHVNAISFDHIQRKREGGLGTVDNAQLSHPYCNSTFKK